MMNTDVVEIKERGRTIKAPAVRIRDMVVVVTGRGLRIAAVQDEEWLEEHVENPEQFVTPLRQGRKADIFTFIQRLPDTEPKHPYPLEWDNLAVIQVTTYDDWWENKLPQVTRKSIRRGIKRGVTARVCEFDDDFVNGIVGIHNEATTRQGMPFYHYGKDFEVVKREYGTFPGQSIFIGAYCENVLIGMIKLVCMGPCAGIMQILSMTRHYDKRPTNILIAKAVEVCEQRKIPYLVYRKFIYGNKTNNSLTEFKRRNGFEKVDLPRYYIPLNLKGRLAMGLKLHLGLAGILPGSVINFLLDMRSGYYRLKYRLSGGQDPAKNKDKDADEAEGG